MSVSVKKYMVSMLQLEGILIALCGRTPPPTGTQEEKLIGG